MRRRAAGRDERPREGLTIVFPPALILIGGAVLVPVVPRGLRSVLVVGVPAVALWYVAALPDGASVTVPFLTYHLEVLRADRLSLVFGMIFSLIGVIAGLYAWSAEDAWQQVAALLYAAGALGVTFAGDYLTLYAFWELMAIASTVLVWAQRTPASARAGTRYLLVHLAGGGVLLAGILFHAGGDGSILFRHLDPGGTTLAPWLILAAFCLNAAVPPLGAWLPDAYPRATVSGAIFLSALTTKAAVYALLRGFAGWDVLVPLGVMMALYGVVYAVLANDIREILAYHIISQVGYMVAAAGIGTELAVNGATAHAVCHILYKALLFMGTGVVIATTGRRKLTELGGFGQRQRLAFGLYMVGAFSIAGFPLWNGFVSKSMVVEAAGEAHLAWAVLLLHLASVGTFLSTGLKLPYFTWMGEDRGVRPEPAPATMLAAMAVAAFLCTLLGVQPGLLYQLLPYPTSYDPYTAAHVVETVQLLLFTFFAFSLLIPELGGEATLSVDTDVLYRRPARVARTALVDGVNALFAGVEAVAAAVAGGLAQALRDPAAWLRGRSAPGQVFDADRARPPLLLPLTLAVATFAAIALGTIVASKRLAAPRDRTLPLAMEERAPPHRRSPGH